MLLDRIDIDGHGPLSRVELGPFAEHLNVICSPEGSGKTAIARFIRDSLINREYPLGMMSSSSGRIVWADQYGKVHCRREQDGTATGRRTVEFESRGDYENNYDRLRQSWIADITRSNNAAHSAQSLNLPESIVDGVITDSATTSVARVVSACVRSGLDDPRTYRSLPIPPDQIYQKRDQFGRTVDHREYGDRRELRQELANVEAELARIQGTSFDYEKLVARRNELAARLAQKRTFDGVPPVASSRKSDGYRHLEIRLDELYSQSCRLRVQESELRRWIAELDADLPHHKADYGTARDTFVDSDYKSFAESVDANLRRRLEDLDVQMIHWRRALMEVRGIREALVWNQSTTNPTGYYRSGADQVDLRRERLRGFMRAMDRYDQFSSWRDFYNETYQSGVLSEDIDVRIDSATRQIEWLLDRYVNGENLHSDWYQSNRHSDIYRANRTLAETLGAVREDLKTVRSRIYTGRPSTVAPLASVTDATQASRVIRELDELNRSEQWLVGTIEQLAGHRESLLRTSIPDEVASTTHWARWNQVRYDRERAERVAELRRIEHELERCLAEAADIRRSMRQLPVINEWYGESPVTNDNWIDREAIAEELRRIDDQLASRSRVQSLLSRREELTRLLGATRHRTESISPLAEEASRWLIRLSAGRLQRVDWPYAAFREQRAVLGNYGDPATGSTGVRINGRDESQCNASDRAIASMAVRMAASNLLARTGRSVPLVIETHRELLQNSIGYESAVGSGFYRDSWSGIIPPGSHAGYDPSQLAYRDFGYDGRSNHPIAAALHDYVRAGRQVILLTSSNELAHQLNRVGARTFHLRADRIVHPHRPLWRPHYASEKYVGPHAHTYGAELAPDFRAVNHGQFDYSARGYTPSYVGAQDYVARGFPRYESPTSTTGGQVFRGASVQAGPVPTQPVYAYPADASTVDINRHFDTAWREAYGLYDNPERFMNHSLPQTEWATDGIPFRDGYYFADSFTTAPLDSTGYVDHPATWQNGSTEGRVIGQVQPNGLVTASTSKPVRKAKTPFFLTVDSPIDQAPSIDAVGAARLRGLNVSHINHLMQQDPNRLSDALGLANVDAETIRRWQSECRLVCRVPHLRGFDARILVGCGVTDPAQLSAIHPTDLLDRVESFLATDAGQRILMSGSSYELSRITSWIAAANTSTSEPGRFGFVNSRSIYDKDGQVVDGRVLRGGEPSIAFDSDRYEYDVVGNDDLGNGRRRKTARMAAGNRGTSPSFYVDDGTSYSRGDGGGIGTGLGQGRSSRSRNNGIGRGTASGAGSGSGRGYGSGRGRGNGSGRSSRSGNGSGNGSGYGNGYGQGSGSSSTSRRRSSQSEASRSNSRSNRGNRSTAFEPRAYEPQDREIREYEPREYERSEREPRERRSRRERSERRPRSERESRSNRSELDREDHDRELRFYLQRSSPVVDAPSIGARMATRLEAAGIFTVDDLVNADPETLASSVDHKRVNASLIETWQQQATLVCRIPMLRGHDAQLLVAAGVTTPEEVAAYDPTELLGVITPIANSSEGKRIIRGGKTPDLDEMRDWITYAAQNRELIAA